MANPCELNPGDTQHFGSSRGFQHATILECDDQILPGDKAQLVRLCDPSDVPVTEPVLEGYLLPINASATVNQAFPQAVNEVTVYNGSFAIATVVYTIAGAVAGNLTHYIGPKSSETVRFESFGFTEVDITNGDSIAGNFIVNVISE